MSVRTYPHYTWVGVGLSKRLTLVQVALNPACGVSLASDWRINFARVWLWVRSHKRPRNPHAVELFDAYLEDRFQDVDWMSATIRVGLFGGVFYVVDREYRTTSTLRELLKSREKDASLDDHVQQDDEDDDDIWWFD